MRKFLVLIFASSVLMLSGCSGRESYTPTATAVVKRYTLVPTFTPTAIPTSTATATNTPTVTFTPTATRTASPTTTPTVTQTPTVTVTPSPKPVVASIVTVVQRAVSAGEFGYGIQAHLWFEDKQVISNQIKEIGFGWVKQQVRWSEVETSPGQIDWGEMDSIINTMTQNNIKVLFSVVTSPRWTRPNLSGTDGPPEDFATYFRFVSEVSKRYCGRLGAIEVWNEQNLQREWQGFPLDAGLYLRLLRGSYDAIQTACSQIVVVSGAPTPAGDTVASVDDLSYLQAMYANGLANYSEAVGAHPSGFANPPDVTIEDFQSGRYKAPTHMEHRSFYFQSTMLAYRQVMLTNGDGSKQLWPTEFGWAVSANPDPGYEYAMRNTPETRAHYIVKAYEMMRGWGFVGIAFLWNLNFPQGEQSAFRILDTQAYGALKEMKK